MAFSKRCFSALVILGALTTSLPAWADIPPEDTCLASDVGKSCTNATGNGSRFQAGICKNAMCTRSTPDGPMSYACYRCEADTGAGGQSNEAGAAGSSLGGDTTSAGSSAGGASTNPAGGSSAGGDRSGGGGGSAGTAGTKSGSAESKSGPKDGGGCSVSLAHGGAGALGAVLAALGLLATHRRRHAARMS